MAFTTIGTPKKIKEGIRKEIGLRKQHDTSKTLLNIPLQFMRRVPTGVCVCVCVHGDMKLTAANLLKSHESKSTVTCNACHEKYMRIAKFD